MKRVIVDYAKLTNEILTLLVEKFPDGYDDADIIRFKNHKDESIEAVEVKTEDTIYLVKISTKLSDRMVNYEDEDDDIIVPLEAIKGIDLGDDEDISDEEDDDEEDDNLDKPDFDGEDEEDQDPTDIADDDSDDDED